jgi:hypothetical protein
MMKIEQLMRNALISWMVLFALPAMAQEDARDILSRAIDLMLTGQMELSIHIETTEQDGRVEEKDYDILMGKFGDVEKTRMVMQKPERARGITIVITSQPQETGIIEVFTPSNGKVRKMKATAENMERVGSNMVFSSYTSQDIEDVNAGLVGRSEVDGESCYLLEVQEMEDSPGEKAQFLVEESSYHLVQIQFFDLEGNQTRMIRLSEFKPVGDTQGKIQPMRITAEDFRERTFTSIQVLKVAPRKDLKEEDFVLKEIPQ